MHESLKKYGLSGPKIMYTDNPAADKLFLEGTFKSLTEDVVPVEKYPTLKPLPCPADIDISVQSTASGIEGALANISDDLDFDDETSHLVVGFDAEWNVDLVQGGGPCPTAIVRIAYGKWTCGKWAVITAGTSPLFISNLYYIQQYFFKQYI
jgi:hypothetical protein